MQHSSAHQVLSRYRAPLLIALSALLLILGLWQIHGWSYRRGLADLAEEGRIQLDLYVAYLQGELEKYQTLPELLANDKRLVKFLMHPGGQARIEAFNRYLETVNRVSDAADTYLMDREGLTIAASNWQAERPFVGRNFSFRPYFKQAMQGRPGRYFALGSTSQRRGYYFAYPVRHQGEIQGAVVIKINMDEVERHRGRKTQHFLVTDPDGVIFLTTRAQWRFHSITPLATATRQRVLDSRRYPDARIQGLGVQRTQDLPFGRLVQLQKPPGHSTLKRAPCFLQQSQPMPGAGWTVHVFSSTRRVDTEALRSLSAAMAITAALLLLGLLFWQQQHNREERRRFERRAREALMLANDQLEARVTQRTRALTQANEHLRHTRGELIQAAKLAALGQMSAGINHEINQPLSAIRSYADNCRLLLERGRLDDARHNLRQISQLTERMARIGAQLKVFARKTSGQLSDIPLRSVIDGSLQILSPAIRNSATEVRADLRPESLRVRANDVLLQQILVNLMNNAVQAMEDAAVRQLRVTARLAGDQVVIRIEDSGPGIAPEHLPHIFEAFYTTKESGQGLGLGLSITYRIVQEMQGSIRALQGQRGACFEIRLPAAGEPDGSQ